VSDRPILPYVPLPVSVKDWDPRLPEVAEHVITLIDRVAPGHPVEHVGSSAVPGLIGKGIIDLVLPAEPEEIPGIVTAVKGLGFGPQQGPAAWPDTRPMLVGTVDDHGTEFQVHLHIVPHERDDFREFVAFRDALRADPVLRDGYVAAKTSVLAGAGGSIDGRRYSTAKSPFVEDALFKTGIRRAPMDRPIPLAPGATIGILGGGQLGRMLALAARTIGFRIAILDPDPACPAAALADEVIVGGYDDTDAALQLADASAVITYELEHVGERSVAAVAARVPVRPGITTLRVTQDRLAERRFLHGRGEPVAAWREVTDLASTRAAADELGYPLRLKAAIGGYDGRSQARIGEPSEIDAAYAAVAGEGERAMLLEAELAFDAEISVTVARDRDGRTLAFPVARNLHDRGVLVETVAPAPVGPVVTGDAMGMAGRLARGLDVVGLLTVELFVMPDQRIVINELAPRVHNSAHWTIEGAQTSQFEQHIRAITGLPLGTTTEHGPTAMVNLLGTGVDRPARMTGLDHALHDPGVHVHVYGKRRVFERRKMGHVTVVGHTAEEALERAWAAAARISWA
jgi:5-(carboxyamino)imidazole ribonucleotide synthase